MKTKHYREILVCPETAVSTYPSGDNHCCVLIEQGQSFALNFGFDELEQLTSLIHHLQQIKNDLIVAKKAQVRQETKLLASYSTTQLLLPEFSSNND